MGAREFAEDFFEIFWQKTDEPDAHPVFPEFLHGSAVHRPAKDKQ